MVEYPTRGVGVYPFSTKCGFLRWEKSAKGYYPVFRKIPYCSTPESYPVFHIFSVLLKRVKNGL
jgi:hypothetical protein